MRAGVTAQAGVVHREVGVGHLLCGHSSNGTDGPKDMQCSVLFSVSGRCEMTGFLKNGTSPACHGFTSAETSNSSLRFLYRRTKNIQSLQSTRPMTKLKGIHSNNSYHCDVCSMQSNLIPRSVFY